MSHILFISHACGIHGAESVMMQAVKACRAAGTRVTVVLPSLGADEGLQAALRQIPGVQTMLLPYKSAGVHAVRTAFVKLFNRPAVRRLTAYVEQEHVDVIYANTSVTILGAALAQRTHVRLVWHWHEPVDAQFGWHASMKEMYRRMAEQADTIICISELQKAEWEQALGITLTNAQVVYNPIKPIGIVPAEEQAAHKDVCIGFIGHFEARKNIGLLVRTFERLHTAHPDTKLLLCGAVDEKDEASIRQMTALRAPIVEIWRQTPEVESFYHRIDLLVLPSWRETMPLVVLEAMQAGVCMLQTERSGMKERLEDGQETLFFSPNQPDELMRLLEQCMDAGYRKQIAANGQRKAVQLVKNSCFDEQIQRILCK